MVVVVLVLMWVMTLAIVVAAGMVPMVLFSLWV